MAPISHSVMLKVMTVTRYRIGYSSKMHNANVGQKRLILNIGPYVPAAVKDSAKTPSVEFFWRNYQTDLFTSGIFMNLTNTDLLVGQQ